LSLINQTYKAFVEAGVDEREIGIIQGNNELTDWSREVQICSIDTLARRPKFPDADIIIFDEVHKRSVVHERWMVHNPDAWFIGLSATPWAVGMDNLWNEMIIVSTVKDLIDQKYLAPFKYYAPTQPDLSGVKITAGDYQVDQLAERMSGVELTADIVQQWLKRGEWRPTFCFAVNRRHAAEIQHQFEMANVPCGYIDALTPVDEREALIEQLRRGDIKVICNIGCLTTGLDAPFVSCLILARPTKSEMLYCLDKDTEILTSHGWKGMGEVSVGDCAATLSNIDTGEGKWASITGVIQRDMSTNESWISYEAPRANFRVTDQHTMIYAVGKPEQRKYKKATALEMANEKGSVFMRTAVEMNQTGIPLTDDELYFIGIMMTDGTWTSTSGYISQSERHPKIIEKIEKCLQSCGIGYGKRKINVENGVTNKDGYTQRYDCWTFHMSAGKPKPHKKLGNSVFNNECKTKTEYVAGITGYRHLLPYLDKDFSPALMSMSKSQLLKLIDGIWDGDGSKKLGVDYTPRSWEICSSNKSFVDRLSALCAINGLTPHVRCENGPSRNGRPIWIITITPKDWRSCGGYSHKERETRPQIEVMPPTKEKVWCVETETGTIITRRKGKVTVMGNCQIVGRVLRTHLGKENAIILDHSSTGLDLGRPDEIFYDDFVTGPIAKAAKQERQKKEKKPRLCPACQAVVTPKAKVCECGFEFKPAPSDIYVADGDLSELGSKGKIAKATYDEKQMWYSGLLWIASERGYSKGWSAHTYKKRFGVWPRGLNEKPDYPSQTVLNFVRSKNIAFAKNRDKSNAQV
jgi:superfamily II DNA or RNA helicase